MKTLTLIYHFHSSKNQDSEFVPARYQIVYLFSESGLIGPPEKYNKHFSSLDELKAHALELGQEFTPETVRLLSVQDYNIGLDGARDLVSFPSTMAKYGEILVTEAKEKKKGLLGKLFS